MNEDLPIFEISYNDYNDLLIKSAKDIDVEHFLFLSKYQNTYFQHPPISEVSPSLVHRFSIVTTSKRWT